MPYKIWFPFNKSIIFYFKIFFQVTLLNLAKLYPFFLKKKGKEKIAIYLLSLSKKKIHTFLLPFKNKIPISFYLRL